MFFDKPAKFMTLSAYTSIATTIDSHTRYIPLNECHQHTTSLTQNTYYPSFIPRRWDPTDFIYTDGSKVDSTTILGAGIAYPATNSTVSILVHAKPERNTINRAELAAIAQVLIDNASVQIIRILTDSAFCIYVIRNFITSPSSYEGYLHEDLLHLIADMLLHRESQQYYTHIGKVKSHTGIQYNEIADQTANNVATGETENPDIEFTQADPITTGLRTWLLHDDP